MSDATDRTAALALLTEYLQPTVAPTLTTTANTGEVDVILDRNRRARTWVPSTAYNYGDVVLPPIRNGRRYKATIPGTSALVDPGYSFWSGASISEGTSSLALTWVDDGPDFGNIYDVRKAAYEGWRLKAQKASQLMSTDGTAYDEVYRHCMEMAEKFAPVLVA